MKIIDITPEISADMGVFPGDTAFSQDVVMSFQKGDFMMLSNIKTTVHLGAHADAPNHYHAEGCDIASRSLHHYLGPCQVVQVALPRGERIYPRHLTGKTICSPRVLFRTDSFPDPNSWNGDFNALSPELVSELAEQGVILVGLDTPSVDPESAKELISHHAIYRADMAILEGLVLTHVAEGHYFLIALPLKIKNGDAAPVRAVLCATDPTASA